MWKAQPAAVSSLASGASFQYPVEVLNREADIRVRYRWVLSPGPLQGAHFLARCSPLRNEASDDLAQYPSEDLATISRSATRVELPPYVLGSWCFGWAPPRNALWRARNFDDCGNRGGIRFSNRNRSFEQGRFDWRASCEITSIKLIATKYRVSSYCHANGPMFVGDPVEGLKVFDVWRSKGSLYLEDASDEAD